MEATDVVFNCVYLDFRGERWKNKRKVERLNRLSFYKSDLNSSPPFYVGEFNHLSSFIMLQVVIGSLGAHLKCSSSESVLISCGH